MKKYEFMEFFHDRPTCAGELAYAMLSGKQPAGEVTIERQAGRITLTRGQATGVQQTVSFPEAELLQLISELLVFAAQTPGWQTPSLRLSLPPYGWPHSWPDRPPYVVTCGVDEVRTLGDTIMMAGGPVSTFTGMPVAADLPGDYGSTSKIFANEQENVHMPEVAE